MSEPITLKNRHKEKRKDWLETETVKDYEGWFEGFEKKMRKKYAKLCETRIHDMKADAVATFIEEEIFGQEPSEILGG